MSLHWTYRDVEEEDLLQGDILERTDALVAILKECHTYFCREEYTGFAVLTQSCDLVRRNGECKAPYISIAVIREFEPLLPAILEPVCSSGFPGVFLEEGHYDAIDAVRKIINQNDQARGLFYLHPITTEVHALKVLATPSVAMLRISIALRRQHYEVLRDARRYHLDPEYANKLGWLAGNLFSRIATKDWEDHEGDPNASAKQSEKLLEFVTEKGRQNWVPRSWLEAAEANKVEIARIKPAAMRSSLEPHKPPTPCESAAEVVADVAGKAIRDLCLLEIETSLAQSSSFAEETSEHLASLVHDLLDAEERGQLQESLDDEAFISGVARHVALRVLSDFIHDEEASEGLGAYLAKAEVSKALAKRLGGLLRPILNDDQRAAAVRKTAEGRTLLSQAAIKVVEETTEPWLPILGSVSKLATNIGNRVKNDGRFKDALRRI